MRKSLQSKINEEYTAEKDKYLKWLNDIYRLTFVDGKNSKQKIRSKISQEIDRVKRNDI